MDNDMRSVFSVMWITPIAANVGRLVGARARAASCHRGMRSAGTTVGPAAAEIVDRSAANETAVRLDPCSAFHA